MALNTQCIERLIGSIRREILNKTLYWNANDLQNKLDLYGRYYNKERCHCGIDEVTPMKKAAAQSSVVAPFNQYRWEKHYRGLFQLPIAASVIRLNNNDSSIKPIGRDNNHVTLS